ncbi:MAG: ribonuclease H-like YkuK family protein [Patescibacteria group bacterium]
MYKKALSDNTEQIFHSEAGDQLSLREVVLRIRDKIALDPQSTYEIVVGSDSEAAESGSAAFVTAIVVRKIGNGAIYFWTRSAQEFHGLRDRIWKEAFFSITLAQEIRSTVREVIGDEVFWEDRLEVRCIHLDMGLNGPTKSFIDGIAGMVRGFGFVPVIKPYSYGASVVADRHT